jgi:hypothetical protein
MNPDSRFVSLLLTALGLLLAAYFSERSSA